MAEEYQQPQLHRSHEAEEEGDKREYHDDSKNTIVFPSSGDEVANMEGSKDRGFFGFKGDENKVDDESKIEPMKFDTSDNVVGDGSAVEATERGLFGSFMGKKEDQEVSKVDENEVDEVATELEKVKVSESEETKVKEEKEEKKLSRSGSSSSGSSSDEEEKGEDGEKKKKKKGLKEKIKEMVSGEEEKTEELEKNDILGKEVEKPQNDMLEKEVEAPNEKPQKVASEELFQEAYAEPAADQAELENGVMYKTANIKDSPPKIKTQEPEQKEKKGILEKIKEKIPGYSPKAT